MITSSRAASGRYYKTLADTKVAPVVDAVCTRIPSNQETEIHAWLSAVPAMKEWNGDRKPVRQIAESLSVLNKRYEASIDISADDFKRDKTGIINMQMDQLAMGARAIWYDLLAAYLIAGTSNKAYDGHVFFDTDHSEGSSGTQLNYLQAAQVSALNVGTATAPTVDEMASAILGVINYMAALKDDQGRYLNRGAAKFAVITAANDIGAAAQQAVKVKNLNVGTGVRDNPLPLIFDVQAFVMPELASFTTQFFVCRTDAAVKPFIQQVESEDELSVIAEGSERATLTNKYFFGATSSGAVAGGFWQYASMNVLS